MTLLGFIEHDRGTLNPATLEMLTFGRNLGERWGTRLQAAAIGGAGAGPAGELAKYGVTSLRVAEHPELDEYAPQAWARALHQLTQKVQPRLVLAAGTERGNEILASLGALADLPMAANCIEVPAGEPFRVVRYRWGSSLLEEAALSGSPKLLTLAPHVVEPCEAGKPVEINVESFSPSLELRDLRVRVSAREEDLTEGVNLKTASVVIGGGRGVGTAEGFQVLEELAAELGGAVGGSRVATNNGWRPHSDQIGLTGNRIAPQLYIACGISGAIQHLVGCKGAKHVLVINKDREAPFLKRADYAAIGDLHEIIPALTREIQKRKTGRAPAGRS